MRKLCLSLIAAGALVGSVSNASAFEAMLGGDFPLHTRPHGHHIMTLVYGDIVNIDRCDHSWCWVTHGPDAGYIYMSRVLDGRVYGPRGGGYGGGGYGYGDGGLLGVGADIVTAPVSAAGDVVDAGVSILR